MTLSLLDVGTLAAIAEHAGEGECVAMVKTNSRCQLGILKSASLKQQPIAIFLYSTDLDISIHLLVTFS